MGSSSSTSNVQTSNLTSTTTSTFANAFNNALNTTQNFSNIGGYTPAQEGSIFSGINYSVIIAVVIAAIGMFVLFKK